MAALGILIFACVQAHDEDDPAPADAAPPVAIEARDIPISTIQNRPYS